MPIYRPHKGNKNEKFYVKKSYNFHKKKLDNNFFTTLYIRPFSRNSFLKMDKHFQSLLLLTGYFLLFRPQ